MEREQGRGRGRAALVGSGTEGVEIVDTHHTGTDANLGTLARLQCVEAMLLAIVRALEAKAGEFVLKDIDWQSAGTTRAAFDAWWADHKARDKAKHEELVETARSKVSAEELQALVKWAQDRR